MLNAETKCRNVLRVFILRRIALISTIKRSTSFAISKLLGECSKTKSQNKYVTNCYKKEITENKLAINIVELESKKTKIIEKYLF